MSNSTLDKSFSYANLSEVGNCGSTCRTAQSRYPAAFKKISTDTRLFSVTDAQK
jgi:hypothetical protein